MIVVKRKPPLIRKITLLQRGCQNYFVENVLFFFLKKGLLYGSANIYSAFVNILMLKDHTVLTQGSQITDSLVKFIFKKYTNY